jgi:membrane protein
MTSQTAPAAKRRKSAWKPGRLTLWRLARNVWAEINANNLLGRSSELAFDFLFALVPLILFMITLFGLFASRSVELQNNFLSYFADLLPPAAFQLLRTTVAELATSAGGGKLTFGIVVALWFASGGVASMISALNLAYHVRETRSWFTVRTIALGLTLFISILLLAASFAVLVGSHLADWLRSGLRLHPMVVLAWKMLQWPAATLFVVMSYSLIYYFGPDLNERRWRWITPGSAFGAFLWLLASIGFRVYLHFFNTYSRSYGSLGAIMILLVWLYVTGFAFLIGGEINAEIERTSTQKDSGQTLPPL